MKYAASIESRTRTSGRSGIFTQARAGADGAENTADDAALPEKACYTEKCSSSACPFIQ